MAQFEFCARLISPRETWALRAARLWPEKSEGPECALPTDDEESGFHVGAFDGEALVSVASVVVQSHPLLDEKFTHRLRAMATAESHVGKGAGRAVIRHAESVLRQAKATGIWCDARHVALGFYARMEWDIIGASYEVPQRGGHRLARRLL